MRNNTGREIFQVTTVDLDLDSNPSKIYNEQRAKIKKVKRNGGVWKPIRFLIQEERDKYIQQRWDLRKRERELREKLIVKDEIIKTRRKI